MTWVADTSWLYALIDDADPHHAEARAQAREPDPVEIPEAILAETLDLIRYRHGKGFAVKVLDGFVRLPHFVLGGGAALDEAAGVWRSRLALSYADAVAIAVARGLNAGLRSFDRRQLRALLEP
jgi:predicted nucleic acid-binding protein